MTAGPRTTRRTQLNRAAEPDRVEHGGRREIAVRQLPDETGLGHVQQGRRHAALGALAIGEIALLDRDAPQIFPRKRTDFTERAHEEVRERLLRLRLGRLLVMDLLRVNLLRVRLLRMRLLRMRLLRVNLLRVLLRMMLHRLSLLG